MRRKVFACVSALSLLLCVATAVVWVRSYFVSDRVFSSSFEDKGK